MSPSDFYRMTETDHQILSNAYWVAHVANAARPRMVLTPTYESYRRALYGWPVRDWFLILNYGLLAALIALVFAILYAVGLTA